MVRCSSNTKRIERYNLFVQQDKQPGRGLYNIFNQQTYQRLDLICGFLSSLKKQ